jgi:2-oxoglutarate ferredoxin oxidoreductase subunit alpha
MLSLITNKHRLVLIDGSRLIVEACAQAGADVYVGYPITPASLIYTYASRRFPSVLAAPDEITVVHWMAGLSAAGRLPVTATSFPGLALMVEGINMAYMMELPMLIVLAMRLGPSTGAATVGGQGELIFLNGLISGGYTLPVFCIADMDDCWRLPPAVLQAAVDLRSPVVLLTSKEMVMTQRSFDLGCLADIAPVQRQFYDAPSPYRSYDAGGDLVPPFLPVGNPDHQVRLTASTHDVDGMLRSVTEGVLANTRRLQQKVEKEMPILHDLNEQAEAETLVVAYGITAGAAREAVATLRAQGEAVSLLVARTLLPIPHVYYEILDRYPRVVVAEENLRGQFTQLLYGQRLPPGVRRVNGIGRMVSPERIAREVRSV